MMMKEKISEGLTAARRKLSQRALPDLQRVSVEQLARELDLENEGRKLGAAGLPPPEQTALSAIEARVVQRVETARHEFVQWASARLDLLDEPLRSDDAGLVVSDALAADKAFERKAVGELAQREQLVKELAEQAAVRERELEEFRARNALTRAATYPEGGATFARYAILLALIVMEGVANAYFFSQGLESGLIGGFLAAALFAAVNLVTAFVLGKYAVPLVFHRNGALMALGAVAAVFAVCWMMTVGLTIAHFRDSLMADAAEPARAAWLGLKSSPFGLRDVMSWLLFAISVLFAVFALFDGLSSDDRYPGYGDVARRARQSRDDYLGELQEVRSRLEAIRDEAFAIVDTALQKANDAVAECAGRMREKKWARTQLDTALIDAENCLGTLLRIFRDANVMHRRGVEPPAYFATTPALQKLALPDFGTEEDRARLAARERTAEQLAAAAEDVRGRVEAAFNAHVERLKPAEGNVWRLPTRPKAVEPEAARR